MSREEFIRQTEAVQGALRRFLTAICSGNTALADDIAQEALVKAYLMADSLRDASKFKPWVYRIAYNSFLNHRRSLQPVADYSEASAIHTIDSADDGFKYQALYAALDRLGERERTAVLLFYLDGYSIKEIAEITEASQDAVKQQLSRGRTRLREILKTPEL